MSGLAALFHRDGRPTPETTVRAMLNAAPYRGPDGRRVRTFGAVGLGHAALTVTPEDRGVTQPLVSARSGCAIIADARLDNRDELLARLPDPPPRGASDAELILRAYERWGEDAAAALLGDFAFVVWDPRARRLVCARDTSGQRPLFYRCDERQFAAASEIHQLLQDPAVPVSPDDEAIRDSLIPLQMSRNEKDGAATFYAGIRALPAGHLLVADAAGVRARRYWELAPPAELRYRDAGQYAEHYRELLYDAVRARLRSAGPIGALLSGGLDSSSIVCAAQELYRAGRAPDRGFATFTFAFGGLDCDERDLVEDLRAKYGFAAHHLAYAGATDWLDLAPTGFREAPNMGARAQRDVVGRAAAEGGFRALLTGDWADGCVFGSPIVFDTLLRRGRFGELRRYLAAYRRLSDEPLRTIVAAHCLLPLLPVGAQRRIICAWLPLAVARHRARLLPLWMPDRMRDDLLRRQLDRCLAEERGRRFASPAREGEYRLLYPPEIARHPAPWSFEIWRPFADRRLHEFLLAIPPEEKWAPAPGDGGLYAGSKQLARRGLRGILPESIRARATKTTFGAVFEGEVIRNWSRYEAAFGPGARSEIADRGYVDPDLFWRRLVALRSGNYSSDFMYVLRLVNLETWLRTFRQPRARLVQVEGAESRGPARRAAATAAD